MVPIIRQGHAEPSTSNAHIAMPLPSAHEVIRNKYVGALVNPSVFARLRDIGLCTPSHRRTPWGVTELCLMFRKQSMLHLDHITFGY